MTTTPSGADMRRWTGEQLEVGIATALRRRQFSTAGSLLTVLGDRDRERAEAVRDAVAVGTTFACRRAEQSRPSTLAVDFDGPLHWYRKGWQDGTIYDAPTPGALACVWALTQLSALYVFTCRNTWQVAEWLDERGVPVALEDGPAGVGPVPVWNDRDRVLVTNRMLPALRYLDDRGLRFEDWQSALFQLELAALGLAGKAKQ